MPIVTHSFPHCCPPHGVMLRSSIGVGPRGNGFYLSNQEYAPTADGVYTVNASDFDTAQSGITNNVRPGDVVAFVTKSGDLTQFNVGVVDEVRNGQVTFTLRTEVTSSDIKNIPSKSITPDKLADNSVGTTQLANNSVTGAKIADETITSADLADGAVTNAKLGNGAVGTDKIANGAVTSAKIADGTITTTDLANNSVTGAKIKDGEVGAAKLASNAVTNAKIADGAVTSAKIANNAVTSAKIANNAVTNDKIAGPIPISKGGTGATTRVAALKNLLLAFVPGDTVSGTIDTAGYVTNGGLNYAFTIPIVKNIEGTVTINSMVISIRQDNKYLYENVTVPASRIDLTREGHGLGVVCKFTSAPSGVTNNDAVGVYARYTFTVS